MSYWHTEIGFVRNREKQYYAIDHVKVVDGVLRIKARCERLFDATYVPDSRAQRTSRRHASYTSGTIVSCQEMLYGRLEVVARSPCGAGMWPAI